MIKAVIFDFDGVIVDSEPLHFESFQHVFQEVGISFTEEEYWSKYLAMSDKDLVIEVMKHSTAKFSDSEIQIMVNKKAQYYMKLFQKESLYYHGIKNVLIDLSRYFPMAIASGALLNEIEYALQKLEAVNFFKFIVSAEDVTEGKPNPQIFFLAHKKLQALEPELPLEACLVIEDSIHGILAAHNAKMKCLAVAHSYKEEDLYEADAVIPHVSQLNANLIKELFK